MRPQKITNVRYVGKRKTKDITVDSNEHLFYANGIVTSNSHAISYAAITAMEFWLKYHYPLEYVISLMNNTPLMKKKAIHEEKTILSQYVAYARKRGIKILGPDVNKSKDIFEIENGSIRFSLSHIKNVGNCAEKIVQNQPFVSIEDFVDKILSVKINKRVIESLVAAGAFESLGPKDKLYETFLRYRKHKRKKKRTQDNDLFCEGKQWHEDNIFAGKSKKELIGLERSVLGNLCLSEPVLYDQYREMIKENNWNKIGSSKGFKTVKYLGKIVSIKEKISRKENEYLVVTLTDDLEEIEFFVFQSFIKDFRSQFDIDDIVAVALKKFEDNENLFYDGNKQSIKIEQS